VWEEGFAREEVCHGRRIAWNKERMEVRVALRKDVHGRKGLRRRRLHGRKGLHGRNELHGRKIAWEEGLHKGMVFTGEGSLGRKIAWEEGLHKGMVFTGEGSLGRWHGRRICTDGLA
jgi:hypothetical protein